ncbi:MAG: hypothetical protein SWK76_15555 [Actinomycetota bacterium]|nr:hypothetical protein [Actinomycetota bacterium]
MGSTARGTNGGNDALLRELCDMARDGGAEDAVVIAADDVIVDPRVRLRCMIAPWYYSSVCGNCPPYDDSIEVMRSKVARYEKAVFFRVAADQICISAPGVPSCLANDNLDNECYVLRVGSYYILVYQIVTLIEQRARQLDYEPPGFAACDCKAVFCLFHNTCRAIKDKSKLQATGPVQAGDGSGRDERLSCGGRCRMGYVPPREQQPAR